MSKFFSTLTAWAAYPFLLLLLSIMSEYRRLLSWRHAPQVRHERPYDGEKIVLLALYEKGTLRPDTRRFIAQARQAGYYVLAVNTMKLDDPAGLEGSVDCYIERFNFGRDFGSYKIGFEHIRSRGWDAQCPRLLMVNDSIFFSDERMPAFLSDMMESETEVLGSTENYEIIHHFGSFCIALGGKVLRHRRFREFWRRYRLSDVRPTVIRHGEQELSRTLRRCASSPAEVRALYGTSAFLARLQDSTGFIDDAIRNARVSPLTGWKRFSVRDVIEELRKKYLIETFDTEEKELTVEVTGEVAAERVYVGSLDEIRKVAETHLQKGSEVDQQTLRDVVISELTSVYMSGSQIHQNAATLLNMGLPIVKLDGLYRGMFIIHDVQTIGRQLSGAEALELQGLLLERPYGGDALRGWRRAAFIRGLI